MKKELFIVLMIVSLAGVLSAEGKQDNDGSSRYGGRPGRGRGHDFDREDLSREEFGEQRRLAMEEYLQGLEVVAVEGTLSLVNGELPFIESEGVKYVMMAPWQQVKDLGLENAMTVSVEGYLMPGPPLQWDESEKVVMVTKALIEGEEIEIDHDGKSYGMMGGRGRGCYGDKNRFQGAGMAGRRS